MVGTSRAAEVLLVLATIRSKYALLHLQRASKALLRMSAMATTVLLVRHGETDWNLEHRLQGQMQPGPPLNALGLRQAKAVGSKACFGGVLCKIDLKSPTYSS